MTGLTVTINYVQGVQFTKYIHVLLDHQNTVLFLAKVIDEFVNLDFTCPFQDLLLNVVELMLFLVSTMNGDICTLEG